MSAQSIWKGIKKTIGWCPIPCAGESPTDSALSEEPLRVEPLERAEEDAMSGEIRQALQRNLSSTRILDRQVDRDASRVSRISQGVDGVISRLQQEQDQDGIAALVNVMSQRVHDR